LLISKVFLDAYISEKTKEDNSAGFDILQINVYTTTNAQEKKKVGSAAQTA
jgi:DNA-directed RNA polymerase alpha subunit